MLSKEFIIQQLPNVITAIELPSLGPQIKGKVRDCYVWNDLRVLVSSDRLSAFDVVLSSIPGKGKILNDLTDFWFKKTSNIIPNHVVARPHPNVFIGHQLEIIPIEIVVRGYLAGSAWRDYQAGRQVSGVSLPAGLRKYERLKTPIVTPSTKEQSGSHDMPISKSEILSSGLISESLWDKIEQTALTLYSFAHAFSEERGLLFMDTKYEFGLLRRENQVPILMLADEIHTQDCSRYVIRDSYETYLREGREVELLDKEFLRTWLMDHNWQGEGAPPELTTEIRAELALKYIQAYEQITGETFSFTAEVSTGTALEEIILSCLHSLPKNINKNRGQSHE